MYIFWSVQFVRNIQPCSFIRNIHPCSFLETFTPTCLLDTYSPLLVYYISRKIPVYSLIRAYLFIRELRVLWGAEWFHFLTFFCRFLNPNYWFYLHSNYKPLGLLSVAFPKIITALKSHMTCYDLNLNSWQNQKLRFFNCTLLY